MCTIRKSLAVALALTALPAAAGAQPVGGGGNQNDPVDAPPTAKLAVSPNPALAGQQLVVARADFGGARAFGGDLVTFDASASTDDVGIVKYEWDLDGNGTYERSTTTSTTSRRYTTTGTFAVKVRVTDGAGHATVASQSLIVHRPPVARLTATPLVALVGQEVTVDGSGSTDDNGIDSHAFDLDGDGTYEVNRQVRATTAFTTLGEHTIRLRVTDVYGATSTDTVKITVHRAPTAAFTATPQPAVTDEPVTFDGSSSSDDEPIARYEWDLDGNGTFETDTAGDPKATMAYTAPGTVNVRLRVTDSHGVQDVVTHPVTIDPRPVDTVAPVVTIAPGRATLRKDGRVRLTVACPAGESRCTGRVDLRSLRGARSAALGGRAFDLAGGQRTAVTVKLSKADRRLVRRLHRLRTRATAVATDTAGNTGTAQRVVTIRR